MKHHKFQLPAKISWYEAMTNQKLMDRVSDKQLCEPGMNQIPGNIPRVVYYNCVYRIAAGSSIIKSKLKEATAVVDFCKDVKLFKK